MKEKEKDKEKKEKYKQLVQRIYVTNWLSSTFSKRENIIIEL